MLNRINATNLKGDVFGGLTAAVIALPMALAFGIASGAGAAAGLWGAVIIGLVASLFGGTPTLISEPTGPMTVVFTSVIISFTATAETPEQALAMAFSVGVLAGIFQILFGLFRLGRYVTMMPYTVISGFMSGIGIILVILQLGPFLGQDAPKGGVMATLAQIPGLIQGTQGWELALSAITLLVLWFTPASVKKLCPPQLLALLLGTLLSLTLFASADLRTIPDFSAAFPKPELPTFSGGQMRLMVVDAAVLGMLGCIDALLTSVVADSLTRTEHDSNKELIGQGLANMAAGLFGALPGAGATMGTVVNIQAGGRTALSGIIRAIVLMLVVLLAAPLASQIPLAVLAAIAVKVDRAVLAFGTQASLSTTQLNDAFIKAGRASSDDVRQLSTVARNLGLHLALVVSEFEHGEAIERIVDELERDAEVHPIGLQSLFLDPGAVGDHGADAARGREQLRRLGADHVQVGGLTGFRVVRGDQLQHLALGDNGRRVRKDAEYVPRSVLDHQLE